MTKQTVPPSGYPVFVRRHESGFEVSIRELLLTVRTASLQEAYDRLLKRQREVIAAAAAIGSLDDMPASAGLPPIRPGRRAVSGSD